jgi:hypothetical protein
MSAPRLAFNWQVLLLSIAMESGRIGIFNNPGTGYENFIAKMLSHLVEYLVDLEQV